MDLNHLLVVTTICDTGSFQLASEKLNKARSAVSQSVKLVEEHFQVQIFDRSQYRPEVTAEGRLLVARIRQLLGQARDFEAFARQLSGPEESELRISVSSVFPMKRLSEMLLSVRAAFPVTTVHFESEVGAGERMLLAEQVDLAIVPVPMQHSDLTYKSLETMELPLVIAAAVLDKPAPEVTRADLAQYPQIVVSSPDGRSPDTSLMAEAPKWYVTELAAKKDLICAELGWGRVPHHLVAQELAEGSLVALPTLGETILPICLARRATHSMGVVAQHIWTYFD